MKSFKIYNRPAQKSKDCYCCSLLLHGILPTQWISSLPNIFFPLVNPSILTRDSVTDEMVMMFPSFLAVFLVSHVYLTKSGLSSTSDADCVEDGLVNCGNSLSFSSVFVSDLMITSTEFFAGTIPCKITIQPFIKSVAQASSQILEVVLQ